MNGLTYIDKPITVSSPPAFKVISTFAGAGGSSTGYVWAGGKVLLAVEWDSNAAATYRLNYPDTHVYEGDISELSLDDVLRITGLKPGELDIFDGSPPCTGFSTTGKREFNDPRNQLFREYVRLLRGLQPKAFVMENVPGLVAGKMKLIFAEIMRELRGSGYRVSCRKLNAQYFGVPQSRERLIFIGVREDFGIAPSHPTAVTRPITAGQALEGVVIDEDERQMLLAAGAKYQAYQEWALMKPGQKRRAVTGEIKGFNCRKWNPRRPAYTLVKNDCNISMHGAMHWVEQRRFTVSEYKRFASFPDDYQFAGEWKDAVARMGNSVPPMLMYYVAKHIYQAILGQTRA